MSHKKQVNSTIRWISPVAFILAWELIGRTGLVDPFFLPPPTAILKAMFEMIISGELFYHMAISLCRALGGYLLAALLGLGLGVLLCFSRRLENILDPVLELLRPVPTLALVPLVIIWFGIGNTSKIIIVMKACFFPIFLNTVSGIKGVNIKMVQAARSLGADELQLWTRVIIPAAMPVIFTGLRISTAISMMAIVGVELLAADSGLGFMILDYQRVFSTDKMFVGIITLSLLGFCMDALARMLQRYFVGWHVDTLAAGKI